MLPPSSARLRTLHGLGLFLIALLTIGVAGCSRQEAAPEPVRSVRTLVLDEAAGRGSLEFAGEVRSRVESRLGFQVGGKVVRRFVELGQPVRPGQPLAQIDARDLRLGQDAAQASVVAAQTQYEQAERDLKRLRELRDQGFISAAQLERQEATTQAAQATLRGARAQAGVQGNQADYATLKADAAGVITSVDAEPGQVVAPGVPVITLAHDGPRDISFSVPEDRVGWVRDLLRRQGAVKVRRWGSQAVIAATVREVAAAADPVTRTFQVKADVGTAGLSLGQTVTVLIDTGAPERSGTTYVPLTALVGQGRESYVWVLDGRSMTVQKQAVQVSGVSGDGALVSAGLKPGTEIVTAGVHVLMPGQKVTRWLPWREAAAASGVASGVTSGTGRQP